MAHPIAVQGSVVHHQDSRTSGHERHTQSASITPLSATERQLAFLVNCRSRMTLIGHTGHAEPRCRLFTPGQPMFIPGQPLFVRHN
jgi:hypothetical protein